MTKYYGLTLTTQLSGWMITGSLLISLHGCYLPGKALKRTKGIFDHRVSRGRIDKELNEASGLVASINNPGLLWVVNDGGHGPKIYLITKNAKVKKVWTLKHANNFDWEDLTIGKDSLSGKVYLYIGEIGDNDAKRPFKAIYKIEEPIQNDTLSEINSVEKTVVQLADGNKDSEALMFDPVFQELFLLSKREDPIGIYKIPDRNTGDTIKSPRISSIPFSSIVAAGISPSGKEVIIKDYRNVYYWKRDVSQSIPALLRTPPIVLPYRTEMQGEAICFALDESGYYTLSESPFKRARLFFYNRRKDVHASRTNSTLSRQRSAQTIPDKK